MRKQEILKIGKRLVAEYTHASRVEVLNNFAEEIEELKYEGARTVLEEFLRKVDWFMWDKKTMKNIANWINKKEKR